MHGDWRRYLHVCYTWQRSESSITFCESQQRVNFELGTVGSECMYSLSAKDRGITKHALKTSTRDSQTIKGSPTILA